MLNKNSYNSSLIILFKSQFILPVLVLICILMGVLYFFNDDFFLIFFPVLIISLIALPLIVRFKSDVFSLWSWLFYSCILGIFFRCLYIYFDLPSHNDIDTVFLLGRSKYFLFPAMILIFFGVLMMVIGYLSTNKNIILKNKIFTNHLWDEKRFFIVSISLIVISLLSLVTFINIQGGLFSVASLSSYRGVSDTLSEASTHSYLRLLVSFSGINMYLLTTWIICYKKRKFLSYALWIISFFTFLFFNFYISQRGAVVFALVQIIAISYYLNKFRLPKLKMLIGLMVALVIFQIMSAIRNFNEVESNDVKFSILKALEPAILTTNMIDVSKTAHIINAVPEKLDYQYGATLTTIFIAWIPREFWPEKPVTNVDNTIGMKVFGATTYGSGGVPPGIFAELYWNFWIPGVIIGCFLLGALLKIINQTVNKNLENPNMVLIYVINFMFVGLAFLGSSFSSVLIGVLQTLIPTFLILKLITKKHIVK